MAAAVAIGSLAAAVAVAIYVIGQDQEIPGGTVLLIALVLFGPLTVFLVASGRVREFSLPGGWRVTLSAAVRADISNDYLPTRALGPGETDLSGFFVHENSWLSLPVIELSLDRLAGKTEDSQKYGTSICVLASRLRSSGKAGYVRYVVVLDDQRFFSLVPLQSVSLDDESEEVDGDGTGWCRMRDFVETIKKNPNNPSLRAIPGYFSGDDAPTPSAERTAVLDQMRCLRVDGLPVVSGDRRLVGIVERGRLTQNVIVDLAKRS